MLPPVGSIFYLYQMNISDHYKVGYVMKTHGLKGEITISLNSDAPVDWENLETIFIEKNSQLVPYFIEAISIRNDKAFVKLDDVNTPEQAAMLKGGSLYLSKDSRPKLAKGEFYDEDVIGFEVFDDVQGPLGFVEVVEHAGPNRFLVLSYIQKEIMIPINGPFIKSINKSKKKISVSLPEGFLEI
jgi:16S rRNA processing protein RimM